MSSFLKIPSISITALRMHSASTVQIPQHTMDFNHLQPSVCLKRLNLHSASSFHVPSLSSNQNFQYRPTMMLSPIQRNALVKMRNFPRRRRVYPEIEKCNAKRCLCCKYLSCKSNIKSTVNGRVFNVNFDADVN